MDRLVIKMHRSYEPERSYICSIVFGEFLGLDFSIQWTDEKKQFYGIQYQDRSLQFADILFSTPAHEWLLESSSPHLPLRRAHDLNGSNGKDTPVVYGSQEDPDSFSLSQIDFLGSMFFMLTRYEEMYSTAVDSFGRYDFKQSIFYKENLLKRCLVNEYLELLKQELLRIAPSLKFKPHSFRVSLSHDVDVPITFDAPLVDTFKKGIGDLYYRKDARLLARRISGRFWHAFSGNFDLDPNYNFRFIMDEEEKVGLRGLFNFIPMPGTEPIDSRYELNSAVIQGLLKGMHDRGFEIGFHPSYYSFKNLERTQSELDHLNILLQSIGIPPVRRGRHHFLRWSNPETWKIWNDLGMTEDGSVGYGLTNGFRAGCCYKYSVFDLANRRHLPLIEEPLIFMDVNSDVNDEKTLDEIKYFKDVCKSFHGNYSVLYHNDYIISRFQKQLFQDILKVLTN